MIVTPSQKGPGITTVVCSYIDISAFTSLTSNNSKMKKEINFFCHVYKYTLFKVCRIIAWPIWNQGSNIFQKILMSTCAGVSKFGSSVPCKQGKFRQKIHSKWKMWILNFEQWVSIDVHKRFSDLPMILFCLPLTGIFPLLKLGYSMSRLGVCTPACHMAVVDNEERWKSWNFECHSPYRFPAGAVGNLWGVAVKNAAWCEWWCWGGHKFVIKPPQLWKFISGGTFRCRIQI